MTSWSSVPLTGGQLTKIRAGNYAADYLLTLCRNRVVFAGQVNSDLTTPTSWAQFNYNNVTVGAYTDVEVDQVIVIAATNDKTKATFRGRIRKAPTSGIIYTNEASDDFAVGAYWWVLDTFEPTYKLSRPSTTDPATAVELVDFDLTYAPPAAVVVGLRMAYVDNVDSSSGKMRVAFNVGSSYAVAHGDSISSYAFTFKASSYTVISGALASSAVTVDFNPGEQWGKLVVTTANGQTKTRHIYIFAHDASNPPDTGFADDQLTISGDLSRGWTMSAEAFTGIDSILPNTFAVCWRANENYGGVSGGLDSTNNIAFVGWLQREDDTAATDPTFSVLETARLEFTGIGPRLARLTAQLLPFTNVTSATNWGEIVHLTPWRAICHFLHRYTTALNLADLAFDDVSNGFEFPALSSQGGNAWTAVSGICDQINAVFETASDGRLQVCRSAEYLAQAARNALTEYIDYTAQDVVGEATRALEHNKLVGIVDADGAYYNLATGQISVFTVRAPGMAQGEAQGRDTLSNQILTVTTSDATALTELRQRAGNKYEVANNTETLTCQHMDGLTGLQPSRSMLYTFTLDALDVAGVNRISLTTATLWMLESVSYGRGGNGTTGVRANYRRLPRIGDPGDNTTQVASNSVDTAIPDIGLAPFNFELPELLFPDIGTTIDAVAPTLLDPPPGTVAPTTGQNLVMDTASQIFWLSNFITLTRPKYRDITPSDLGSKVNQAVAISPFFTNTAIPAYNLAADDNNSAIWNTANAAAVVPVWSKGADITGKYGVLRTANVDGTVLIYSTNNIQTTTYDFAASDGGWTTVSVAVGTAGHWSTGTGWVHDDWSNPSNNNYRGEWIQKTITSATVTRVEVTYDVTGLVTGMDPTANDCFTIVVGGVQVLEIRFANQTAGTDKVTTWTGASAGVTNIQVANESSYYVGSATYAGSATIKKVVIDTLVGGNAAVSVSTDKGATYSTTQTVGTGPGSVGGFDVQRDGANSFGAAQNIVSRATTLGGAYSSYYSITGGSAQAACIVVPYFNWAGTRQTVAANPDIIVALTAVDGSSRSLLWIEGGATPGTVHDLTPVAGMTFDNANCVTVSYNHHIAVFGLVSGVYKLYTTTNQGGAWTNRGTLTTPTFLRDRRNDSRAVTSGTNKGQLYNASGSTMGYSSTWASGGGSIAGLFPRTMPANPVVAFDPLW